MAFRANNFAEQFARTWLLWLFGFIVPLLARGQQYPFVQITVPNQPRGCFFPFEDSHGALWFGGCETGREGLVYFDGSRFIAPLGNAFPAVIVNGMAEDSDGGIWLSARGGVYRSIAES
jgi:hypothetical protein